MVGGMLNPLLTCNALSPNALSPCRTLSTAGLSEKVSYSEKLWN